MKNLLIIKTILFLLAVAILASCGSRSVADYVGRQHESIAQEHATVNNTIFSDYQKVGINTYMQVLRVESPTNVIYYDSIIYNNVSDDITYRYTIDNRRNQKKVTELASN